MHDTFDATVTIYNVKKMSDATTDTYVQTVFEPNAITGYSGVSWFGKTKVSIGEAGLIGADEFRIRIRENVMQNYIPPEEWNETDLANLKGKWTMQNGDFIRKGKTTQTDPTEFQVDIAHVVGVHDNRRGTATMRHIAIEGK